MDFKKPVLARLPVLDTRALTAPQLDKLAEAYDRWSMEILLPLSRMAEDPVRAEIDRLIAETLDLPDPVSLRNMLGREPVVCLKRL